MLTFHDHAYVTHLVEFIRNNSLDLLFYKFKKVDSFGKDIVQISTFSSLSRHHSLVTLKYKSYNVIKL